MKNKLIIAVFAFAALSLAACKSSTQKTETKEESKEAKADSSIIAPQAGDKVMYQCPMHPEEVSDKPGQCSKCGMDLEKITIRGKDTIKS